MTEQQTELRQAVIAWLAGLVTDCPYGTRDSHGRGPRSHQHGCCCNGTGQLIPFEFLRVYNEGSWSHADCTVLAKFNEGYCDLVFIGSKGCEGRGWLVLDNIKDPSDLEKFLATQKKTPARGRGYLIPPESTATVQPLDGRVGKIDQGRNATLAKGLTEKELSQNLVNEARNCGWKVYRTWLSKFSPAGFPDLFMVRGNEAIAWELKSDKGKVSDAQHEWLEALSQVPGITVGIVRPADLEEAYQFLVSGVMAQSKGY